MKFLAHLHLASLANSSLLGNLMADFVRGNVQAQWPETVVAGIAMHRRLDVLTDKLPEVREARQRVPHRNTLRGADYAGCYLGHFLARHWDNIHPQQSLSAFTAAAERAIVPHLAGAPGKVLSSSTPSCGVNTGLNTMPNRYD